MSVADQTLDKVGEIATEVIGNAAGAVADPKTAIGKAKATSRRTLPIVAVIIAVAAIMMMIRRRSGASS